VAKELGTDHRIVRRILVAQGVLSRDHHGRLISPTIPSLE
jgi:hypothetical protein